MARSTKVCIRKLGGEVYWEGFLPKGVPAGVLYSMCSLHPLTHNFVTESGSLMDPTSELSTSEGEVELALIVSHKIWEKFQHFTDTLWKDSVGSFAREYDVDLVHHELGWILPCDGSSPQKRFLQLDGTIRSSSKPHDQHRMISLIVL